MTDLLVLAAWRLFESGLFVAEVAQALRLSRHQVNWAIDEARRRGLLCGDNIVKRRNFSSNVKERVRYARARLREEVESRPLEKRGPWPVAHVYPPCDAFPEGMPVYDVGGGHLVQGSAVAALGWRAGE